MAAKAKQRTARAEIAMRQARSSRGTRDSRAKEAEETHRRRMQQICDKKDKGQCARSAGFEFLRVVFRHLIAQSIYHSALLRERI